MEFYELNLVVSCTQEQAIRDLFVEKNWKFIIAGMLGEQGGMDGTDPPPAKINNNKETITPGDAISKTPFERVERSPSDVDGIKNETSRHGYTEAETVPRSLYGAESGFSLPSTLFHPEMTMMNKVESKKELAINTQWDFVNIQLNAITAQDEGTTGQGETISADVEAINGLRQETTSPEEATSVQDKAIVRFVQENDAWENIVNEQPETINEQENAVNEHGDHRKNKARSKAINEHDMDIHKRKTLRGQGTVICEEGELTLICEEGELTHSLRKGVQRQEIVISREPPATDSRDVVCEQGNTITEEQKAVTGQGEAMTGQGEAISGQGEAIPGQGEAISEHGEAITGQEAIPGQEEAINVQGETFNGQGESSSDEEYPGDEDDQVDDDPTEETMQRKDGTLIYCSQCGEVFAQESHLQNHMTKHALSSERKPGLRQSRASLRDRGYDCYEIQAIERTPVNKRKQRNKCVKPDVFRCAVQRTPVSLSMKKPGNNFTSVKSREFMCATCSRTSQTWDDFTLHLRSHVDELSFVCTTCGEMLNNRDSFSEHLARHGETLHENRLVSPKPIREKAKRKRKPVRSKSVPPKSVPPKPRLCNTCGMSFNNRGDLAVHKRFDHTHVTVPVHAKVKSYLCPDCGKMFKALGQLQAHARTHTGETPYTCAQCGVAFIQLSMLNRHLRQHSGEKPYLCMVCGKRFAENDYLKSHMRLHTGEKPFQCRYCGKSFSQRTSLKVHIKCHHLSTVTLGDVSPQDTNVGFRHNLNTMPYMC